jgi:deazaflavin-dependent oxidoreductase (nitroreductase family)
MSPNRKIPDFVWRWIKVLNNRISSRYGERFIAGDLVLLLITTGRKSGLLRTTPLQYEEVNGNYFVASARGKDADWYKNILACPEVIVQVKSKSYRANAKAITDPDQMADFLELRLKRRPRMIKAIMRMEGLPSQFDREDLVAFAENKALVEIQPVEEIIHQVK